MAPNTTTAAKKEENSRVFCAYTKRVIYAIVNLITIMVTCVYISHAFTHYKVISDNSTTLKNPFGQFDLQNSRLAWIFAISRVVFLFVTLFFSVTLPEASIFLFSVFALVFEIPMACVAESNYGYLVSFAQLDLSPPSPSCAAPNMTIPQWDFYTSYGNVVGKLPGDVCQEFVHEGDLLRASLLFGWFTFWIPVFLVALICALCNTKENKHTDVIVHFVGFEVTGWWTKFKSCFEMPKLPSLRRRKSHYGSESSTLACVIIEEKMTQKV